ncbi:MAG: NAD(P)/FAD-dependent oxidoreductase, partial [Alphaproteobacteria bacterium]
MPGRSSQEMPQIVILGAGFAGLEAAHALRGVKAQVTLVDRNPYSLFQPLLYQVATGLVQPDVVATPITQIAKGQKNLTIVEGDVIGIDRSKGRVELRAGASIAYDRLIIATGARAHWFDQPHFARHAQPLKTLEDAETIRAGLNGLARSLRQRRNAGEGMSKARIAIVGGGPTGVETAGALIDQTRRFGRALFGPGLKTQTEILLLEAGGHLLPGYGKRAAQNATRTLQRRGVTVRCAAPVTDIGPGGLAVAGERQEADLVLWTAGVAATPAADWLGVTALASGRIEVASSLALPDDERVFIAGDVAAVE